MIGIGHSFDQEPVDQRSGEPDPHPDTRPRLIGELFGDEVVERAIEVRLRHVHGDPGNRLVGRGPVGARFPGLPAFSRGFVGFWRVYLDQRGCVP
jgi:hypothetical protein